MHRLVYVIALCMFTAAGCTSFFSPGTEAPPTAIRNEHFVLVTAGPHDSLVSLARTYLNDGDKAWQIASFNDIDALEPGQKVVVPLAPLHPSGIYQDGFQTVPVLLYGGLTDRPSKSKSVYIRDFEQQMQYLYEFGFATVSLDQFYAYLSQGDQLPPMAVIVSFDTTRRWAYETAYPILKSRGLRAAFFIRPDEVGAQDRLTWTEVAEMTAGGMDIGLYGSKITPPAREDVKSFLTTYEKAFIIPKQVFKARLRTPCRYFAYPGGKTDDLTIAMLKKHGYHAGFTRKRGANPFFADNFKIKRSYIYGHYTMEQFRQNLTTFRSAELK